MSIICTLLLLWAIALLARVIMSWFPVAPDGAMATIGGFLAMITDPVLDPLRRVMPTVRIGNAALDLSFTVLLFGIFILRGILCG